MRWSNLSSDEGADDDPLYCSRETCYDICFLDEPIELNHTIIHPSQDICRHVRTDGLMVQMFTDYDLSEPIYARYEVFIVLRSPTTKSWSSPIVGDA